VQVFLATLFRCGRTGATNTLRLATWSTSSFVVQARGEGRSVTGYSVLLPSCLVQDDCKLVVEIYRYCRHHPPGIHTTCIGIYR
jgi:hypothetical protein